MDVYSKWIDECEKLNSQAPEEEEESESSDDEAFELPHKKPGSGAPAAAAEAAGEDEGDLDDDDLLDDDLDSPVKSAAAPAAAD